MIGFWVAAGLLSAAAAVLILHRARTTASATPEDPTLAVYKRQLAEIDDLAARGLLGETERTSAHAEAGRRLLAAADAGAQAWTAVPQRPLLLAAAALAPVLALGLYLAVGSPGVGDQPMAARMQSWRAALTAAPESLQPPQLAALLRAKLKEQPNDVEGLRMLATQEVRSGDPVSATRTLERAVQLAPDRPELWEELGVVRMIEAGGGVSDGAQAAFKEALRRDPKTVTARMFLAQGQIERGETDVGVAAWRELVEELPPSDPRRALIAEAIAGAAQAPAAAAGEAAMIRGMVERLAARLEASPDDPDGWVMLVRSYAKLGDAASRDRTLASARARYRSNPQVLQALSEAAAAEPMR